MQSVKAIILAAGVGKRLLTVSQGRPKCLIEVGKRSLLDRYLQYLSECGIQETTIVIGYQHDVLRSAFGNKAYGMNLTYLVNEDYEQGNVKSLWIAIQVMDSDTLLMDADVLFHPMILHRLLDSSYPTVLAMDETVTQCDEECMVVAREGRVVALTKQVTMPYDQIGEGVGFLKVHASHLPYLKSVVQACIERGAVNMEYEDALGDFFARVFVGYEKIGGFPWIEIDFPEDVTRAKEIILPQLMAMDGIR